MKSIVSQALFALLLSTASTLLPANANAFATPDEGVGHTILIRHHGLYRYASSCEAYDSQYMTKTNNTPIQGRIVKALSCLTGNYYVVRTPNGLIMLQAGINQFDVLN